MLKAVSGPAQFQVRTPEAVLHSLRGGLRIEADCSAGGPWPDCGLHFGRLATHSSQKLFLEGAATVAATGATTCRWPLARTHDSSNR
eukprot:10239650-Alexandrium_andersonii.AAC.1